MTLTRIALLCVLIVAADLLIGIGVGKFIAAGQRRRPPVP